MSSTIDATCPKCGKRIGWCGEMGDRPACPKCGHRPPQAELDAAQAEMDAALAEMDRPFAETRQACLLQRKDARLSVRQAAKLLGIAPGQLSDYEWGRKPLPDAVADKMRAIYGLDPKEPHP